MQSVLAATSALTALLLSPVASAQWSDDPALGSVLSDKTGAQVQPKIAATADGGFYVSWYDSDPSGSPAFGYDVYLQRIDALGVEQWAPDGILIADRGFSSTQDYDLDVDTAGHALLVFRDDRFTGTQITATRVSPAGTQVWGATGVQLTSTTAFVAAPKIAGLTDGNVAVSWTQDSATITQKLDSSGVAQWGTGVSLAPGTGTYSASCLRAGESGSAVLSIVHQTGGFSSPKHLKAQKLLSTGALAWTIVDVFDGGSLQFGNFPTFVSDGQGGGVFGWYSSSPSLQCFAQRVDASGTELFPHNGTAGSTDGTQDRVSPSVAYDAQSGDTYLFWVEQDLGVFGVYGQRFDASGSRQWTDTGAVVVALGPTEITQVRTLDAGSGASSGAWVAWVEGSNTNQIVRAARIDPSGAFAVAPFDVSSTAARKSRLVGASSAVGFGALVWEDGRNEPDGDIWTQNVQPDGTVGPGGAPFCFGTAATCPCGNGGSGDAGCDNAQATGGVELSLGGFAPNGAGGGSATYVGSGFPATASPTAIVIRSPSRAMPAPVFGDGLRCVGVSGLVRFGATAASGGISTHVSGHGAGAGVFHYQLWYRNTPSTFCDPFAAFNLSNGLSVTWP